MRDHPGINVSVDFARDRRQALPEQDQRAHDHVGEAAHVMLIGSSDMNPGEVVAMTAKVDDWSATDNAT